MQNFRKSRIFRIFSANYWNQSETNNPLLCRIENCQLEAADFPLLDDLLRAMVLLQDSLGEKELSTSPLIEDSYRTNYISPILSEMKEKKTLQSFFPSTGK